MTVDDPLQQYLGAKAAYDDALAAVVATGQRFFRLGDALMTNPLRVVIADDRSAGATGPPASASTFSAHSWPTADQIVEALTELERAAKTVRQRFDSLSPDLKATVPPPGIR